MSQNFNKQDTKFFQVLTVSKEIQTLIRIENVVTSDSPRNSEWEQMCTEKIKKNINILCIYILHN